MASVSRQDDEPEPKDFNWLQHESRGSTYTSYLQFSQLPRCSFDWGDDGYAGCSSYGGGLLYLSAPSKSKGLIQARGKFHTSVQGSLSTMQGEVNGPFTFGLEVSRFPYGYDPDDSRITQKDLLLESNLSNKKRTRGTKNGTSFQLGEMIDRGCFNYRWPLVEYYLDLHPDQLAVERAKKGGGEQEVDPLEQPRGKHVGTCQTFSCVFDGVFYQVLRIEESNDSQMCFPADSQIVLSIGGPVWFQSFDEASLDSRSYEDWQRTMMQPPIQVREEIMVDSRDFGERPDSVSDASPIKDDDHTRSTDVIRYWDTRGYGLEARTYEVIDGQYQSLLMQKAIWMTDDGPGANRLPTAYHAICTIQNLPSFLGQPRVPRSATFVTAIRFFEGNESGGGSWPSPPNSKNLYDHVGVDPSHPRATGAMWEGIYLRTESVSDLTERDVIGRALEKILQVDISPVTFNIDEFEQEEYSEYDKGTRTQIETIVSNRFICPTIDLKSLFWKIRFLLQVHGFLSLIRELDSEVTDVTGGRGIGSTSIEKYQMMRIQTKVENILRYLIRTMLVPTHRRRMVPMMPVYSVPGNSDYYYVMITIWYVWNYLRQYDTSWKLDIETWSIGVRRELSPLFAPDRLPPDNWKFPVGDRQKIQLLQWYHYASVMMLCSHGVLPESWQEYGLPQKVARLAKAAQMALTAKILYEASYEAGDEIVDRLSFLSMELGLENLQYARIDTVASSALIRVKSRDSTQVLNPGWLPPAEGGPISGPWEIYALCHHSRLAISAMEQTRESRKWRARQLVYEDIQSDKQNIFSFLNTEGTLISTWARTDARSGIGWLDSEATAVLSSTLLILKRKDIDNADFLHDRTAGIVRETGSKDAFETEDARRQVEPQQQARHYEKSILSEVRNLEALIKGGIERLVGGTGRFIPIHWRSFSLPHRYQPDNFFNSLGATPELYKAEKLLYSTSIPPSLRTYITLPGAEGFTFDNIRRCAQHISIFDINSKDMYQQGNLQSHDSSDSRESIERRSWALFESLAEQEVQHRFLIIRDVGDVRDSNPSRPLFDLLFYVLHPETSTCLGDYALCSSRFTSQIADTWIATITLRSWRSRITPGEKSGQSPAFKDDSPIYIPPHLDAVVKYLAKENPKLWQDNLENLFLEIEMSSIVISTNAFGDFSKCTIVSDLISDTEMKSILQEAQIIWQKFVHQPQTGRCLVFLLVLGKICQYTTSNYDKAIESLTSVIILDSSINGLEKHQYVNKFGSRGFELIHWSLDSLLKLNHNLKSTAVTILQAKEDLMAQIQNGPGKRGVALEKMCQEYIAGFEADFIQLNSMVFNLGQGMNSLERYVESLNIESERSDRSKTLRQNENIEKLTYLTIVYLPVTLMAGIYAIPNEHKVLFDGMGLQWFLGGIFILSAVTYTLAVYIKSFLELLGFLILLGTHPLKTWPTVSLHLRRMFANLFENIKALLTQCCKFEADPPAGDPIKEHSSPPDPTRAMEEGVGDRAPSEARSNP